MTIAPREGLASEHALFAAMRREIILQGHYLALRGTPP
jgi:hypothetical protein